MDIKDLKVGDLVYIREDLEDDKVYGNNVYVDCMNKGIQVVGSISKENEIIKTVADPSFYYSSEMIDWEKTEQLEEIIATDKSDAIKPNHYKLEINGNECEVRDVMQAVATEEEYNGFLYCNILKYILRAKKKNGIEDMKKAKLYLEWLIEGREE